jgi:nucleoside-diphosphate-sugar epimerase
MVIELARTQPLFTYSILRPSNVIGKNMTNQSVRSLVNMIRKKLFFYIGPSSACAIATYIHVNDVVDALVLCANDVRAQGEIFNLSNDCGMSEIVDAVAKNAGIRSPTLCIPERSVRLLAKCLALFGQTPLTQSRIDALTKRTRYPNNKIKDRLAFSPRHSIPEAIASLFDD